MIHFKLCRSQTGLWPLRRAIRQQNVFSVEAFKIWHCEGALWVVHLHSVIGTLRAAYVDIHFSIMLPSPVSFCFSIYIANGQVMSCWGQGQRLE